MNLSYISIGLVVVQYLFLMGVICMLLKKFSPRLGIEMPVLIIQFFNITKRAHLCCIHLVYYAPEFIMLGSESNIV